MEKPRPRPIFSVSDFVAVINQTFEYAFPIVEVEGEVASYNINQNKYVFFDIKDNESIVSCFMMVWQLRVPIEEGMKVVVTATPKLTNKGKFSLTVKAIRPSGEGAIKKSFELLKAKLASEGLFSPERKRQLPSMPEHIAVISSIQAAGYADFIKILNDRWSGVKVDVANTLVQGVEASDQIIAAIDYFNQQEILPQVIVIIRGGGSEEDLSVFNDELLVRAVASSRVPTLIGVGHEINESLADLAADVSAATPSNAAQIVVPDRSDVVRSVRFQVGSLSARLIQCIEQQKLSMKRDLEKTVNITVQNIDKQLADVNSIKAILAQLDPKKVLSRGYAMIRGEIRAGNEVEIETGKIIAKAEVKNVREK